MLEVKKLIEILQKYNQDALVVNEQGDSICHIVNIESDIVVLSTKKPIGECNRCGNPCYPSVVKGYKGVCLYHDEDLYSIEMKALDPSKE